MMLSDLLTSHSADAPALYFDDDTWTFGALASLSDAVAATAARVSQPGDRIAIVGDNSPAYVACLYGVPAAGRVVTMVNQRLAPAEMASQLEDSGAVALWGDSQYLAAIDAHLPPRIATALLSDVSVGRAETKQPVATSSRGEVSTGSVEIAWLIYTSGTTGQAKGAMLTHASLLAAIEASVSGRPVGEDEVYLFPFSLCHVAAYNVLIQHRFGRPVVLVPGFDAGEVLELVQRHGVTTMSLAPTMMAMLLDHRRFSADALRTLRLVGYGSAPISEPLLRRWLDALDVGVSQGYGMTELSGNAAFLIERDHRRAVDDAPHLLRSAGRPAEGVALRIADDGEILVRSAQVMAGYWERPAATADTIVDGWLHTGDVGHMDADGYLYVTDRKKDVIVTGGENVSSLEVEDAVRSTAGVVDVAVVGVPDERWGEAICAVVVVADGYIGSDGVVSQVRTQLASYKKPRHVLEIDELPRNGAGKVLKRELRDWAAGTIAARQ